MSKRLACVALISGSVAVFVAFGAAAQPPEVKPSPSTPVTIMGPLPVPVTGSITVSNTTVPVTVTNPVSINNTTPIPVAIVPPSATPTVTCHLNLSRSGSTVPTFFVGGGTAASNVSTLVCPAGVSKIDAVRVAIVPTAGPLPSQSFAKLSFALSLGSFSGSFADGEFIAAISDGTPEISLTRPVRIDKTSGQALLYEQSCSSPIATVDLKCGGMLIIVGTPVP